MNGPVLGSPLAVCDYQSTERKDLIAVDSIFPHRVMEVYHIQHNPKHQWYYLDYQNVDEVLIFKTCDSDETTASCKCICFAILSCEQHSHHLTDCMHSAIAPEAARGTVVRESVELRSIVLY